MMSLRIRIIILVVLVLCLVYIIYQAKKKKIDFKFSLPWMFMIVALMVLTTFPKLLTVISDLVGIAAPMNFLFFFGFVISMTIIYILTVAVSKMSENIRTLTQKVAILEKELVDIKKEEKDNE